MTSHPETDVERTSDSDRVVYGVQRKQAIRRVEAELGARAIEPEPKFPLLKAKRRRRRSYDVESMSYWATGRVRPWQALCNFCSIRDDDLNDIIHARHRLQGYNNGDPLGGPEA